MARWKDDHLWARAHAERAALAEDLAGPSAEQWRHGTLCGQADFLARRDFTVASRTHVAGLQLRADDGPFATGSGPLVTGSTLALMMSMADPPTRPDHVPNA